MKDKKLLLICAALAAIMVIAFVCIFWAFSSRGNEPEISTTDPTTNPYFEEDVTIPDDDLQSQINEIDKVGFDSQTTYWIEKLREFVDVEEELNNGTTIQELCEDYFPNEYREYQNATMLGDDNNDEYPEELNQSLYLELLDMAETFNFIGIISRVEKLMMDYKFTLPYNYNIGHVYNDAVILNSFNNMTSTAKIKAVGNLKDPVMTFIGAIAQMPKSQCAMYTSGQSLYFQSNTKIDIQEIEHFVAKKDTKDEDEKLIYKYFSDTGDDVEYVKLTFKINYELSDYSISDFAEYFDIDYVTPQQAVKDAWLIIYDENGDVLFDLRDLTEEELEKWQEEHPEYELVKPEEPKETEPSGETEDPNSEDWFMYKPIVDEEPNLSDYDNEGFEIFKEIVYEVSIPKFVLKDEIFNRIYKIEQITNLTMPYFKTVSEYKKTFASSQNIVQFIRDNQWSYINRADDFDEDNIEEGGISLEEIEAMEATKPTEEDVTEPTEENVTQD